MLLCKNRRVAAFLCDGCYWKHGVIDKRLWSGEACSKLGVWEEDGGSNFVWHVIQVMHEEERRTMELIKVLIDRLLIQDIFLPEMEVMKRYHGEWHKERALMFPGYIFIVTETIHELSLALGQVRN